MSLQLDGTTGIQFNDGSDQSTAATPYGRKNLIINGDMRIAQRGTSKTGMTGNSYPITDRWQTILNAVGTWTATQDSSVPSGQGFTKSFKLACTTANSSLSAGSVFQFQQRIEGQMLQHLKYGTSSAETLTMSFWVKSNKTGTYVAELRHVDGNLNYGKTYTIDTADTWEKKTLTFEGETTTALDNDNNQSVQFNLWLAGGTAYTTGTQNTTWDSTSENRMPDQTVNLADSTSNYINITGCQLEIGDSASTFEFMPYDMELARCQRYYFKLNPNNIRYGMISPTAYTRSSTIVDLPLSFPVIMRDKPSSVSFNTIVFRRYDGSLVGGSFSALSLDTNTITPYNALLNATVSAGTAGHTGSVICNNNVNGYLAIETEL